jgi:bifunctional UDP-N-acetylglucosamine pyrophosphorylase/glucosamine-1-phosphate N-acetyltransferase
MRDASVDRPIVVVGFGADVVRGVLGEGYDYAVQEQQLGTGDAVRSALEFLPDDSDWVFISPGDTPAVDGELFLRLLKAAADAGADSAIGVVKLDNPGSYGRVILGKGGVEQIVEARDCTPAQLAVQTVNTGHYVIRASLLKEVVPKFSAENDQREYYLTDFVKLATEEGCAVAPAMFDSMDQAIGVNDRWQLAEAAGIIRNRLLKELAESGVTIVDPASTYVEAGVRVGPDTVLLPNTFLEGATSIGSRCLIGPSTRLIDSVVNDDSTVHMSYLNTATVDAECSVGPFAHLRPGTRLHRGVKVGNFVEIKNAEVEENAKVPHLSYVGDASVGAAANIGAGTITCNYDGKKKHRTEIGAGVFVGSNSTLVAPLNLGHGCFVAAGSVITKDVPPDALAFGRARQEIKADWAKRWRE